uniref:F-box-like family protein n=1 Tax=Marseillevirus LCMAC201 TaxID=2506605 RepID=A0A481YWR4_9VIRU|nr:MAG: F-box-like family protein [Marseillevirus LCMAC201]
MPNIPEPFEIEKLPPEMIVEIISKLDMENVLNLCLINRAWSGICRDELVWKLLHQKDFPTAVKTRETWYESYKVTFADTRKYIKFELFFPIGRDVKGIYFMQNFGNEEAIEKFLSINKIIVQNVEEIDKNQIIDAVKKYGDNLRAEEGDNGLSSADIIPAIKLSGKITIPGDDREYTEAELGDWWDQYYWDIKHPQWNRMATNVTDLYNYLEEGFNENQV